MSKKDTEKSAEQLEAEKDDFNIQLEEKDLEQVSGGISGSRSSRGASSGFG